METHDSTWSLHRRIIQPAFQTRFLRQVLSHAVPAKVEGLIYAWEERCIRDPSNNGTSIDVMAHMSNILLDILGQIAFSYDFGGTEALQECSTHETDSDCSPQTKDKLYQALRKCFQAMG